MDDQSVNQSKGQQSEHERQVAEEEAKREGRTPEDADLTPYEAEVEAEQRGTTADEIRDDEPDAAVDSAYRPRSG